ncbi:MAG: PAS domain S-box protein [Rhizobiales bacterium]|nr:PAS domain S-box protein [Hyphomicrobiales bacterium]
MGSRSYSFLDVAVLEAVRGRLSAGDALLVLSVPLDEVLWANGPGAALLGHDDIFSLIGTDPELPVAARRQIEATPGFPAVAEGRSLALRLGGRMLSFAAVGVTMPDGEAAILLAASDPVAASRPREDVARRAIAGLSGEGQFVALVDRAGALVAASPGFGELGLAAETLRRLALEVAGETDRLVKRLVPAARASLPAGMARLTDALNLLMVVDEQVLEAAEETVADPAAPAEAEASAPASPAEQPEPAEVTATEPAQPEPQVTKPAEPEAAPTATRPAAPGRSDEDGWYFNGAGREPHPAPKAGHPGGEAPHPAPAAELSSMPLRFVWRTDAEGRFSAISDEFRTAFGEAASDIVGRPFGEVARAFGLDPDGEIAGLLARRDTWSGRSVLWPVAGTDLKVPVDLAALPVYGRDRGFEGFRGFGVARMGDAMVDPEAIGLALAGIQEPAADEAPEAGTEEAPAAEAPAATLGEQPAPPAEDPFRGEPPALKSDTARPAGSDKIIRLEERRPGNAARGLSAAERLNFREIGEKLRNAGLVSAGEPQAPADTAPEAEAAPAEATPPMAEQPAAARPHDEPQAGEVAPDVEATEARAEPESVETAAEPEASETDAPNAAAFEAEAAEPSEDATGEAVVETPVEAEGEPDREDTSAPAPEAAEAQPAADTVTPEAPRPAEAPAPHVAAAFLPSAFAGLAAQAPAGGVDTALLSRLPLPLLVHAGDRLFYANREFLQITGYNSLAALDEAGGLGAIFGEPYASDDAAQRKLRLRRRDGAEFPVDAFLQSVGWDGGKALLLALRRAEEPAAVAPAAAPLPEAGDVDARLEELRTIIDTATDGVVIIGNDGKIRSISRPAEALFGVDGFNLVGQPFTSLFAMESQKAAGDYLAGLAENGVASVLNDGREVIGREAQGRFIPLFMTIGRLPQASGFCAVLRDITNWKRAEENLTEARAQAERASSHKTEFLARVSHEIRTPLNAIIGFSELMLDEKFGPIGNDRYKDYLRDINKSGNHVLDLVNDLLDISKIEAGQQEMSYEAVSLAEVLGEAVAMMQPQANRERVIIRSSFASRLPEVVADLRSVRQIALNLLSNAIRYTPAGGQVIVSTAYEASGDIVMRVRDTGIGMAAAEIEQAMKPFKQINALKRPRGDGTGLGLPLTKAMVEANRARFAISSAPGEGTLVEITFPSTRVLAH